VYVGRTTDKTVAEKHYKQCRKNPYSTGKVQIVTDTSSEVAYAQTRWESIP